MKEYENKLKNLINEIRKEYMESNNINKIIKHLERALKRIEKTPPYDYNHF